MESVNVKLSVTEKHENTHRGRTIRTVQRRTIQTVMLRAEDEAEACFITLFEVAAGGAPGWAGDHETTSGGVGRA